MQLCNSWYHMDNLKYMGRKDTLCVDMSNQSDYNFMQLRLRNYGYLLNEMMYM